MEEETSSQNLNGRFDQANVGATDRRRLNNPPLQLSDTEERQINQPQSQSQTQSQYSMPGILHFIQHEWARFEMERSQWEMDRAELQARIAFLQGERKGQENLKSDLVRRIKMLEYVLKQERAKFHKLKYGTELQQGDMKPPIFDEPGGPDVPVDGESPFTTVSNISWRQGRQLLRQYLQEIGYTDTIIDVRSNRVRSLLGLNNNTEADENLNNSQSLQTNVNGNEPTKTQTGESEERTATSDKAAPSSLAEAMILDTEAAVLANFEFLSQAEEMDEDDDLSDDWEERQPELPRERGGLDNRGLPEGRGSFHERRIGYSMKPIESAAKYCSYVFENGEPIRIDQEGLGAPTDFDSSEEISMEGDERSKEELGLGELAQLTIHNEVDTPYNQIPSGESYRKTWNAKYTLRSHFDSVRALAFHPTEPVLITGSEDNTLKLWNLEKTVPAKKSASLDVEPLYTFRGHTGPVLCLAINQNGEECYSGGLDGSIFCWNLSNWNWANMDPYDSFDPKVLSKSLEGHTDAIWGLSIHHQRPQLLSCSADGTIKLWSLQNKTPLLYTYVSEQDGAPTSVDFVRDELDQMVAAHASSHCIIYDLETAKPVVRLESSQEIGNNIAGLQINRVVAHPTLPLTITAHEDHHIRFFDNTSGKLVHSMVAHLDSVTSLAVDPHGLYLLSGSHDCSIRLWNFDSKTCVQEITAHRKKFDESILDVAFHPSRPYIASAGADALAKVFV